MLLIRELLYKEKTLDDFDIDSDSSIFKTFMECLFNCDAIKLTEKYVDKNITDMFNDACYICTIALIFKRPFLNLGVFREIAYGKTNNSTNELRANAVLSMVYYLLKITCELNERTKELMNTINNHLRECSPNSNKTYYEFFNKCDSLNIKLQEGYFKPVIITKELLDSHNFRWKRITSGYNKNKLESLVCFWKDARQRNLVIDYIEKEIQTEIDTELPF